jgi:hypothetical protein
MPRVVLREPAKELLLAPVELKALAVMLLVAVRDLERLREPEKELLPVPETVKDLERVNEPAKELLPAPREMNWALVSMELVA